MRVTFIFFLLLVIAWMAHSKQSTPPIPAQPHREISADYERSLSGISDQLFSPLDTRAPNPVGDLMRLTSIAREDADDGLITHNQSERVEHLCFDLIDVNRNRETFELGYRSILNRDYDVRSDPKTFFVAAHLRKWKDYTDQARPPIVRGISRLPSIPKHSTNTVSATHTGIQKEFEQ